MALRNIGLIRPRVVAGTAGTVAGFTPAGEVEVLFDNQRTELVHPSDLATAA